MNNDDYTHSFVEYQNTAYHPGYWIGGRIHPVVRAKKKITGYALLISGSVLLPFYLYSVITSFTAINFGAITPALVAVLMIFVGVKVIKSHKQK